MTFRQTPLPSRRTVLFAAALAAATALLPGTPARAEPAAEAVVKGFYDALLDIMRNGPALGFQGRFDKLRPAFDKAFDSAFMTRVIAGAKWAEMADAQKTRLTDAFTRYSVASYARNFNAFDGEKFEVTGAQQYPQGLMVLSNIVPNGEKPVPMNYLMRKSEAGAWKIFDVFLDGTISQLATRRSDFAATLRDKGADGLIQQLDAKTKEMADAK